VAVDPMRARSWLRRTLEAFNRSNTFNRPTPECVELCKKAYRGNGKKCEETCSACGTAVKVGYVPKTLYEVPQDCEVVCKDCSVKQNCITSCRAKQAKCCHSVFGCCPHDARVCV